jgi:hypothetical protein
MKNKVRRVMIARHSFYLHKNGNSGLHYELICPAGILYIGEDEMQILHELTGNALGKNEATAFNKENFDVAVYKSIIYVLNANSGSYMYGITVNDKFIIGLFEDEMQFLYEQTGKMFGKKKEGAV